MMNVFLSGTSFNPSYGGPARSVSGLASGLAAAGISVSLWAPDGSATTSPLIVAGDRLTCLDGSLAGAIEGAGRLHLLHDNGIWLIHNHALAKLARRKRLPRIVSVRGMLEPEALRHRRWKKRLAWAAYQRSDLTSTAALHATAEAEAENIKHLELRRPIPVIPNGVVAPVVANKRSSVVNRGDRFALFIGRLHPIKGLPMLLEAWAMVRPEGWELCIAGPAEDGHDKEIVRTINRFELNGKVSLLGPVGGRDKERLFQRADLFILPSLSENFGMVVAEALSYGVPVLATRAAPWQRLESYQCGWWAEPSIEGMRNGLAAATATTDGERSEMGQRGAEMIVREFDWSEIVKRFIAVYESVLTN